MRVLLLSPYGTAVNPYIGLFEYGLRAAGAEVHTARVLNLSAFAPGAAPDVIHLHWIERYDLPPIRKPKAAGARLAAVERAVLRLVNVGPVYQLRRWWRLRRLLSALAAFQAAGGRVAYTVHNLDPHEAGPWAEPWALRRIIQSADILHTHDGSTTDEIARQYGRRNGMVVIPHGHYLDAYPNQVARPEARTRLDLPSESFVYVCLGLLRPYKGLEELLPAFRALEDDRLRLLIAGRPPNEEYVAHLRTLAGADPRIRIEPRFIPAEEVQVYLNAANVAVLPYRQITTSGAALLAFSFGLPVIAPAIGAFPSLVTPERGLLYAPRQLHAALHAAAQANWSSAHDAILAWVRHFSWDDIGRQLIAAYKR